MRNVDDDDRGRSGAFSVGSVYSKSPSNLRLFGYFSSEFDSTLKSRFNLATTRKLIRPRPVCMLRFDNTFLQRQLLCISNYKWAKKKSYCVLLACGFGLLFHLRLTNGFTDDLCNDCKCRRSRYVENFFEIC